MNVIINMKRKIYQESAIKVIMMLGKDMLKIYNDVTESLMWRNFSKYVR